MARNGSHEDVKSRRVTPTAKANPVSHSFGRTVTVLVCIILFFTSIWCNMRIPSVAGWLAGLSLVANVAGQSCKTYTPAKSIPTKKELALHTYSYCGGYLNVTVSTL